MKQCILIKEYLYNKRKIGLHTFEKGTPPQKYMYKYIYKKYPFITQKNYILEIGPGQFPIFNPKKYTNWFGVDKNYFNNKIHFKHLKWTQDNYNKNNMFKGSFESLKKTLPTSFTKKFDLVCSSHCFEHVFQPINSLKEASHFLKPNGIIVLFVPDPFSVDPSTKDHTHTLYLTKEMINEFFHYSKCFKNLEIKQFRANADIVITANKI